MDFANSLRYSYYLPETRFTPHPLLQNIINGKIYLVLWFWYAFLVPVSFIFGFYRLFTILCYTIRFNLLYKTVQTGNKSI